MQAGHLSRSGVKTVFIGGSTGECHSLTVEERLALARRWSEIVRGSDLQLVVHVGSNCLADARVLASQAQSLGASAISALAPSYFKPRSLEDLVACCDEIAGAAGSWHQVGQRAMVPGRIPASRSNPDPTAPTTQVRRSRPSFGRSE